MTKSILEEAQEIIYGDREKTYGSPDKNLKAIANFWNVHLQNRYNIPVTLDAEDVCIMMALLKIARLENDTTHRDSKVDIAGYIALLDRIQQPKDAEKQQSTIVSGGHYVLTVTNIRNRLAIYEVKPDYIILATLKNDGSTREIKHSFVAELDCNQLTVDNWLLQGYTHFRFE